MIYNNDLISIIVPIYKVEPYLRRCVNSILYQTYRNLEIILVDDGSPDRCNEICDEYAKLDERVIVIHKKNGGLSDARNAGIDLMQGEYITFIDGDDWIHQEYIERLYKLLKSFNADISVCNFIRTTNEIIQIDISQEKIYKFSNIEALEQITDKFYVQIIIACGKLYKKSLFNELRFTIGRLHEDEFITYKLIYKANDIVLSTAQLLFYWQRDDSITGSGFNIKGRIDYLDALEERYLFYANVGLEVLACKTMKCIFSNIYSLYEKLYSSKENKHICLELIKRSKRTNKYVIRNCFSLKYKIYYLLFIKTPKLTVFLKNIYIKIQSKGKN